MRFKRTFYDKYVKRIIDICVATMATIILSPVLLVVSVIVMIKIGRPILFKQERPGINNKIFKMYKFRTMTNDRDENGQLLSDELRLTKFGKLLRSTSLDELPELFNIIKGDMAIVGPRPLLVQYLNLYNERQSMRHYVRPGITGLAQVNGRNRLAWEEKFEYDVAYVQKISFVLDLKILMKTFKTVIAREGISSETSETMEAFCGSEERQGK